MARPVVGGLQKLCEMTGVAPLDAGEKESLEIAFAAVFYERMGEMTALGLLYMTLAGVGAPRVGQFMEKRQRDASKKLPKGAPTISPDVVEAVRSDFPDEAHQRLGIIHPG